MQNFTPEEVARHDTPDDCWVVVEGRVLDVTEFLKNHPGGVAALSKLGRAGADVTSHFLRIGHSEKARAIMTSLQVGCLATTAGDSAALAATAAISIAAEDRSAAEQDEKERAIQWHADRRKRILQRHPEVASLAGHNPFTPLVGFFTVIVHCMGCILAQRTSWLGAFALAYTVGAVCKFWQFAICHDVCHDTAGVLLERHAFLKHAVPPP
jgi:hypothetical protein